MWKDYSVSYIRKNKTAGIFIAVAVLIASLFISAMCSLYYNIWADEVKRLSREEGSWQARFAVSISEADLKILKNYRNVDSVSLSEYGTEVYLKDITSVYRDMPALAGMVNVREDQIEYHDSLLERQFVFAPGESMPLLWVIYAAVLLIVCLALILIIRSAFQFSMNARIYQLGILQSIGATPKQIRLVLLQEALALSVVPVLAGTVLGIGVCLGVIAYANRLAARIQVEASVFTYHYLLFFITAACSFLTVFLSAWFPARKLSQMSPLQAIRYQAEIPVNKMKKFRLMTAVFGIEGELSRKSFYARRDAFRTSSVCLLCSFLALAVFLNTVTISQLSVNRTYFDRYKDTWDIAAELVGADLTDRELLDQLRMIDGVDTVTAYQKSTAYTLLSDADMSDQVNALGGYGRLNTAYTASAELPDGMYLIETTVIALDDESYRRYAAVIAEQNIAVRGSAGDGILVNRIWDSQNSSFRDASYIPFLKPDQRTTLSLYSDDRMSGMADEIAVTAYTDELPDLRERYGDYHLIQILPQSVYLRLSETLSWADQVVYMNVKTTSDDVIESVESRCRAAIDGRYEYTIENRPAEKRSNDEINAGYKKIMGGICGVIACIGIANVFANTLGYMYQRKREFARYRSLGLTPRGITKMLLAEAFIIGVKPILLSVLFSTLFVFFAVRQSGIEMKDYIAGMPVVPFMAFAFVVLAAVGISCLIGMKQMKQGSLAEALKDDIL